MQAEKEQQMQQMQQQEMVKQAGQFANSPMMDPSKNEAANELIKETKDQLTNGQSEGQSPPEGA